MDPDFQMIVQIHRNNYGSLMDYVIAISKQEISISMEKSSNRKLKNRLRRMVRDDYQRTKFQEREPTARKIPEMILWILDNC